MPILLTSGISILFLIIAISWMFYKLKRITFYHVAMYVFLLVFWITISFVRKIDKEPTSLTWQWPIIMACFQFFQVVFRIPIGLLSRKLKSRKVPLLIATFAITFAGLSVFAAPGQLWSSILAFSFTGIFGATYGLQNQYWSENYNIKSVFITVALIAILPSMGSLVASFGKKITKINSGDFSIVILITTMILVLFQILFFFFEEKKETIRLDNVSESNKKIKELKQKDILIWASTMMFLTFGFNLVTSGGSSADAISYKTDLETVILTLTAVIVAILTSLWLVKLLKSYHLILLSHFILIIGLLIGIIISVSGIINTWSRILFLIIITIGFNLFQYTSVGITLHLDHKNSFLILGIWLTFRSFATGSGELVGGEIKESYKDVEKWLIVSSLIIAFLSLGWTVWKYKKNNKVIYDVVDAYEYNSKNSILN